MNVHGKMGPPWTDEERAQFSRRRSAIRRHLLTNVSLGSLMIGAPKMTAREMANAMAGAYRMLGLTHLDKRAA